MKEKIKVCDGVFTFLSLIMWLVGVGLMIWSAVSLSWLRLFIGLIFIIFSMGYVNYK